MVDKKKIDRNRQLITVLSLIALVLVFGQVAVFIYFGGQGAKAAQVNHYSQQNEHPLLCEIEPE